MPCSLDIWDNFWPFVPLSHLHDHEAAHEHEHQHETVRYADHNEYHDQRRRMSERNDELHVPGHLNINYQHLPALIELFNSQSSRPSSKFRLGDDLEIFTAANEYLKQKYHQLQNANEKRKEPKKAISNNYENHVILQYRDNQYPQQQFESPPYKKAEKKKYLSQIEPMSPNKYRNRNRATNQSKDHENHDSHEYLSHLQKYSDKEDSRSSTKPGVGDRVPPNINLGYHSSLGNQPENLYPDDDAEYPYPAQHSPPLPLQKYQVESVEKYVGNSGKEYETAAEKIVEGYMGEYMEKYMNEWYIKYCEETGEMTPECTEVPVIPSSLVFR